MLLCLMMERIGLDRDSFWFRVGAKRKGAIVPEREVCVYGRKEKKKRKKKILVTLHSSRNR